MEGTEAGDVLRHRQIVLIHEDAFIAHYLADVIAQNGRSVHRPIGSDVDAALAAGSALVLSDTVPHRDTIVGRAGELGLPVLVVRSAQRRQTGATTDRLLAAPFAGFQVVELLCDLLRRDDVSRTSPPEPRVRA